MTPPAIYPLNQSLPPEIRAGDSLARTIGTALDPSSTVFLVLNAVLGGAITVPMRLFVGYTPAAGSVAASGLAVAPDGSVILAVPGILTATWTPGRYEWTAFSLDATGNREQIAVGEITVSPDVAGAVPVDSRTFNARMLANIRAVLLGKSVEDLASYKINNRELVKIPALELEKWAGIYSTRVRAERVRAGQRVPSRTVGIVFGGR